MDNTILERNKWAEEVAKETFPDFTVIGTQLSNYDTRLGLTVTGSREGSAFSIGFVLELKESGIKLDKEILKERLIKSLNLLMKVEGLDNG